MRDSMCSRARPLRVVATVFLVVFVLGVTSPTYGDGWGNGKGSGKRVATGSGAAGSESGPRKGSTFDEGSDSAEERSTGTKSRGRWSSGDLDQAQPLSNADENEGGANGQCPTGPYCSTRDGSESGNGNGNGEAVGKPCAGCVGKADNKNPPGQMPNGSDSNNGYECDGNQGIGKTNPAHTGCKGEVTPPAEEKPEVKPPAEEKPEVKPEAPRPPAKVPAPQAPAPEAPVPAAPAPAAPAPAAPAPAVPPPAVLPPTGAEPLEVALGVGGAALLLTGTVLLLRRRFG